MSHVKAKGFSLWVLYNLACAAHSKSYAVGATFPPDEFVSATQSKTQSMTARVTMLDVVLMGSGLLFFAAALGYAALCEHL